MAPPRTTRATETGTSPASLSIDHRPGQTIVGPHHGVGRGAR